jgi:hypothetical protein
LVANRGALATEGARCEADGRGSTAAWAGCEARGGSWVRSSAGLWAGAGGGTGDASGVGSGDRSAWATAGDPASTRPWTAGRAEQSRAARVGGAGGCAAESRAATGAWSWAPAGAVPVDEAGRGAAGLGTDGRRGYGDIPAGTPGARSTTRTGVGVRDVRVSGGQTRAAGTTVGNGIAGVSATGGAARCAGMRTDRAGVEATVGRGTVAPVQCAAGARAASVAGSARSVSWCAGPVGERAVVTLDPVGGREVVVAGPVQDCSAEPAAGARCLPGRGGNGRAGAGARRSTHGAASPHEHRRHRLRHVRRWAGVTGTGRVDRRPLVMGPP